MSVQEKKVVKIYVVGGSISYSRPLTRAIDLPFETLLVDSPEDADILWFTGGEDVDPAIYNAPVHPRTSYSVRRSYQEDQLIRLFPEKFKVGTCRGHQQFHASSGGTLIQHTDRHAGPDHDVMDVRTGKVVGWITSAHHQAVLATDGVEMEVLLVTPERISTTQQIGSDGVSGSKEVPITQEIEAAWWPKINALGIQGHPEWMQPTDAVVRWFVNEIVTRYMQHINK